MRILYLQTTPVPPPTNLQADRFYLLSEKLDGDVLQPIWFRKPEEVEAIFGPGSYPVYTCGRFRYHWYLAGAQGFSKKLGLLRFYLSKGFQLIRDRRHDCIVAYSHMTNGMLAGILKLLTGRKAVIEIATSPEWVYLTDRPRPTLGDRVRHWYSDACLHLSMWLSDRAHFLYPQQLAPYPLLRKTPNSVFHDFVTVSRIDRPKEESEPFVLFVGAPWYLKGVDLLVEAFRRVRPDFPGVGLKLMGFFPDREQLDQMIGDCPGVEILKPRPNPEALKVISQAAILVLPSRCEGMGRVLIEAMAAGVPLIGSDVGGIPFMVRNGECGYVFHGGDSSALEEKLRELLSNPELRRRMGDTGYRRAHQELNEEVYVERFTQMVEAAVLGEP